MMTVHKWHNSALLLLLLKLQEIKATISQNAASGIVQK